MNWQKLSNGVLLKNAPTLNTLGKTYETDIAELGYNLHEIYPKDDLTINPMIIGYFRLLTNELIAIHRDDSMFMDEADIKKWQSGLFPMMDFEEEEMLRKGIAVRSITQEYIESACGTKVRNNKIDNGKYVFIFSDGKLVDFGSSNGLSSDARDFLNVDAFIREASKWYNGDMSRIICEINLQAECFMTMDIDILCSKVMLKPFAYPNGCINYIAAAVHYKSYDVDFRELINSTHGAYEIVEKNNCVTKIKAHGVIFTNVADLEHCSDGLNMNSGSEESDINTTGYVYVMINPSLPNYVKIGKTTREPSERAKELSSATGVPTPFILVYYKLFKDCNKAESVIHTYFEEKGARVSGNREFFEVSTNEAIDMINFYFKIEEDSKNE